MSTRAAPYILDVKREDRDDRRGFDATFNVDTKGSDLVTASTVRSIGRMRSTTLSVEQVTVDVGSKSKTLFLVGGAAERDGFAGHLEAHLADTPTNGVSKALGPLTGEDLPDAWWDVNSEVMFTDSSDIADDLLRALSI